MLIINHILGIGLSAIGMNNWSNRSVDLGVSNMNNQLKKYLH
jgi:hypothetical protein